MIINFFPCLNFDGQGQEAARFYKEVLSGELTALVTYSEANADNIEGIPEEARDLVMNAQIDLPNGDRLMISDVSPGMVMPYRKGNNLSMTLTLDDQEEARKIYGKLAEGGMVSMNLQETFWSPLYGSCIDRFHFYVFPAFLNWQPR